MYRLSRIAMVFFLYVGSAVCAQQDIVTCLPCWIVENNQNIEDFGTYYIAKVTTTTHRRRIIKDTIRIISKGHTNLWDDEKIVCQLEAISGKIPGLPEEYKKYYGEHPYLEFSQCSYCTPSRIVASTPRKPSKVYVQKLLSTEKDKKPASCCGDCSIQ